MTENERVNKKSIVAVGFSLGNGPTTYLAEKHELGAVILQAPFVSAFRVVTHIPILPIDKFKNISRIKNITEPVLIIHGAADDTIPIWHGKKLYEVANDPKESLWIEGAGHFDITDKDANLYWSKIDSFISKYVQI